MGYPKQVYDRVWDELARRGQVSRQETQARRAEIHRRIPEIKMIEREMARHGAGVTRAVIANPDGAEARVAALAEENLTAQKRRAALLVSAGYPADYLREQHVCSHCRDLGFIGPKMCRCMENLLRQEAAAQLGQFSPVEQCSFEDFNLTYYPDQPDESGVSSRARMADVFSFLRRWAKNFSSHGESLLLIGKTGLGKTHLSVAAAGAVTQAGFGVVYAPVQRMMDTLEGEKFRRDENNAGAASAFLDCDLLILDDLGTEFSTQFTSAALFHIVNARLVEERPTIVNTNLELSEIEARYSQRMVSRLVCGYKVLRFAGKDIRYIRKIENTRR